VDRQVLYFIRASCLIGFWLLVNLTSQCFILSSYQVNSDQLFGIQDFATAQFLDNQSVYIPAGKFLMGSDKGRSDEEPAHWVYLDGYYLDKYEITNLQYKRFIHESDISAPRYWSNSDYPRGLDIYPVVGIRWKDASAYCEWAGKRLPTEAEWEKACRGSKGQIYPWGYDPEPEYANSTPLPGGPQSDMWDQAWDMIINPQHNPGEPEVKSVGSHPSGISPYGIHDMIGNASEWTADFYNWDGYWITSRVNPVTTGPAWNHVVRGSAWLMPYGEKSLDGNDLNRCSARSSSHGDTRDARIGFRCAQSIHGE
jgi:formylglycine-generating enzyme required for sulfatase activity